MKVIVTVRVVIAMFVGALGTFLFQHNSQKPGIIRATLLIGRVDASSDEPRAFQNELGRKRWRRGIRMAR